MRKELSCRIRALRKELRTQNRVVPETPFVAPEASWGSQARSKHGGQQNLLMTPGDLIGGYIAEFKLVLAILEKIKENGTPSKERQEGIENLIAASGEVGVKGQRERDDQGRVSS